MDTDDFAWVYEAAKKAGVTDEQIAANAGPPKCFRCNGPQVRRLGCLCPKCEEASAIEARADAIKRAWATVPEALRWVSIVHADLPEWVRDEQARAAAKRIAADLRAHPFVTLAGEPGSGKTTLACALLREWIRLGARRDSAKADYELARTARFQTAHELVSDRAETRFGDHVASADLSERAGILVLDEVGRGRDAHGVVFELVRNRIDRKLPTIFTTPAQSLEELSRVSGDGGLARRLFDRPTHVVQIRRVP